jgi:hypothetical protein
MNLSKTIVASGTASSDIDMQAGTSTPNVPGTIIIPLKQWKKFIIIIIIIIIIGHAGVGIRCGSGLGF